MPLQQGGDPAGEAADDPVLPFDRPHEIEGRALDAQAERRRLRLLGCAFVGVGGVNESLRRNTADVEAGPAQSTLGAILLDQHDVEAELTGAYGADVAAGPTAHDQYFGGNLGHLIPL